MKREEKIITVINDDFVSGDFFGDISTLQLVNEIRIQWFGMGEKERLIVTVQKYSWPAYDGNDT